MQARRGSRSDRQGEGGSSQSNRSRLRVTLRRYSATGKMMDSELNDNLFYLCFFLSSFLSFFIPCLFLLFPLSFSYFPSLSSSLAPLFHHSRLHPYNKQNLIKPFTASYTSLYSHEFNNTTILLLVGCNIRSSSRNGPWREDPFHLQDYPQTRPGLL